MANRVERTARSIALIHAGVWVIGAVGFGIALGGTRGGQLDRLAFYAIIGGFIGWFVGQTRATSFRLLALTADISRGTHSRQLPDANPES